MHQTKMHRAGFSGSLTCLISRALFLEWDKECHNQQLITCLQEEHKETWSEKKMELKENETPEEAQQNRAVWDEHGQLWVQ